jgi:hypothetical protein
VSAYEYQLNFWGEVEVENWIERDLGIKEKSFWFQTEEERQAFADKLRAVAESHKVIIAMDIHEGTHTRLRTIATMTLTLPDGRSFPFRYDFGYGYGTNAARFMFHEGNWSCDCNLSGFLESAGHDVLEMDCGELITISDFKVTQE